MLERTPAKPTVPPTSRESAVAASRVIALAGEVTRAEYIQALIAMEERYPGYGWIEEANRQAILVFIVSVLPGYCAPLESFVHD